MNAETVLNELESLGVTLVPTESAVRYRPQCVVPPALRDELVQTAREVRRLLLDRGRAAETREGGIPPESAARLHARPTPPRRGVEPGQCFDCGGDLPAAVVIGLCFPCRRGRNHNAEEIEDETAPTREPLAIIIESREVPSGPIQITPWCRVVDAEKCATADLARLEKLVERYAAVCDDPTRQDEAGEIADEVERRVDRLAHCGVRVVITETH